MGKARVAPLKTIRVPRLEMTAATLIVKVKKQLCGELQLPINKVFLWTDSTIVLRYLRNITRRFQTFAANRLLLIHDSTTLSQWRHVLTDLNPADLASTGVHELEADRVGNRCCFGLGDLSFYGRRKASDQSKQLTYLR